MSQREKAALCLVCLAEGPEEGDYHHACLLELFGRHTLPQLPASAADTRQRVFDLIAVEGEKMSISGAQPKALVRVSDAGKLEVVGVGSTHILKPPSELFRHLPANEHVTMLIGRKMGLDVPACGLLRLANGELVYVIRRFDRNGNKKGTNDFCQILGLPPEQKNRGTAEQCEAAVRSYCDPPEASLERLFRLLVVTYVLHNGDLHLKNLSLLEDDAGRWQLSPAYDLVNTLFYERRAWCVILPVAGERKDISRKQWLAFGESCGLAPASCAALLGEILSQVDEAKSLLARSLLPADWKREYERALDKRRRSLGASFGHRSSGPPSALRRWQRLACSFLAKFGADLGQDGG